MKNYRYFTILILIAIASIVHAQPATDWMEIYDGGGDDYFQDIYRVWGEDYVLCGKADEQQWIVRIDNDGNVIWSEVYGEQQEGNTLISIVETDSSDFIAGGRLDNNFSAIMVSNAGEQIWSQTYGVGWCHSVIELKNGFFLLAGYSNHHGLIVCIDSNGEVEWSNTYEDSSIDDLRAMRETNGGVIVAGNSWYNQQNDPAQQIWVFKINFESEIIWSRHIAPENHQYIYSMISRPQGGFMISGRVGTDERNLYDSAVFIINNAGELLSHVVIADDDANTENALQLARLAGGDVALVGWKGILGSTADSFFASRLTNSGISRWNATYTYRGRAGFGDNSHIFSGVIEGHDGSILGAGTINCSDGSEQNGVVMKLVPEILEPQFISWVPEDTVFSVLPGAEVEFYVHVSDEQEDDLEYQWTRNEEFIGEDTTVIVTFEELGEELVHCSVSDGEFSVGITWHVTVDDFFIRQTTPDSLQMIVRRGSTLPFTIAIACIEPDAPTIEWSVVNRDNDREYLGEADSIDVCFDLAGEWAVEAEAIWGEERESVRWAVDVRSAVWWWMPHEDAISVNQNEHCDFSVFPFDPDSDSLSVAWWLNGDSLDCIAEALSLDFPDTGEHSLITIVRDGIEADTIHWQITVNDPGGVFDRNTIPNDLALFPPAPNPFNSTTTIGYSLPTAGNVSLTVYDLAGRLVANLVDGVKPAGVHEAVWVADGMASGVYVVKLVAGENALMSKVVLVR